MLAAPEIAWRQKWREICSHFTIIRNTKVECASGAGGKKGVGEKYMKDKEDFADQQRAISRLKEKKNCDTGATSQSCRVEYINRMSTEVPVF